MQWMSILYLALTITTCLQMVVVINAQGFLDPFGLRRRHKERASQEEKTEEDETPEPRRTLPGLDLLNPLNLPFGHGRHRHRDRDKLESKENPSKHNQESHEDSEENIRQYPAVEGRSLGPSSNNDNRKRNQNDEVDQHDEHEHFEGRQQPNYGPCGRNNEYCNGENYIRELGLEWSRRVHNGSGIYLRDPNAPGGKRYVLVGIDLPNEKFGYCDTPKKEQGYCRHLEHCVLEDFRRDFIRFLEYRCDIPRENYVGTCCPITHDSVSANGPDTRNSRRRQPSSWFQPYPETTPSLPRQRTTQRSHRRGPEARINLTCGQGQRDKASSRIVGGRPSDPKSWPWMTALLKTTEAIDHRAGQYCGGVLISEFHVLTAAHCVDGLDEKSLAARVGEYDFSRRNETSSPYDIPIAEKFIHENFNRYTYQNDIAILKLAKSAFYEPRIQSICLPELEQTDNFVNEVGIVTGFGTLWYGGPSSDTLQEISVPIWSHAECQASYTQPIEDTNLCAGVRAGSRDSCQGDSGGPLQLQLRGRWTVVGIVSWGIRCSEPGYPGVYSRVTKYNSWINNIMKK